MSEDNPHDYYVKSMHLLRRGGNPEKPSSVTVTIPPGPEGGGTQNVKVSVDLGKELTAKIVEVVDKAWDRLV